MNSDLAAKASPVTPERSPWRLAASVLWGIAGIPTSLVLFGLLVALMFPVGGGIAHLMFAHSQGENLAGARVVFAGFVLATAFVTGFLRWTRYPLPWYGRAAVAGGVALWAWLPAPLSGAAGPAFRTQGLLFAPLLPIVAFAISAWSERRRRSRQSLAPRHAGAVPDPRD